MKDLAFGSATLAISAGYYWMASTIPESQLADAIGPQGLPKSYAMLLGALSLILIVRSLTRGHRTSVRSASGAMTGLQPSRALRASARRAETFGGGGKPRATEEGPRATEVASQRHVLWRVTGMLAIGVGYILLVPWLGYIPSLAGLIFATTYYQGGSVNRQVAVVALSGAVFFWLLFVVLMGIPQPAGFWPSLL